MSAIVALAVAIAAPAGAQMMMGGTDVKNGGDDHTAREEQEGREVWQKLQAKETTCKDLSDDNFATLGEYFMGQMMGDSHEAMNQMMMRAMGADGEEALHVVMGKRLSGCDPTAAFSRETGGWVPMLQMMWGGWPSPSGYGRGFMMTRGGGPSGAVGWTLAALWWVLALVGAVAIVAWLVRQARGTALSGKTALDILKERYARGDIDQREFEEKKRNLG